MGSETLRSCDPYLPSFVSQTHFFTNYHPEVIENCVKLHLTNVCNTMAIVDDEKYELDFKVDMDSFPLPTLENVYTNQPRSLSGQAKVKINALQVDDSTYCIEFVKMSGSSAIFYNTFKYFRSEVLKGFCNVDPDMLIDIASNIIVTK